MPAIDVYKDITDQSQEGRFFNKDGSYNEYKMLQNETVEEAINSFAKKKVYASSLTEDLTKDGLSDEFKSEIISALGDGQSVILPITGRSHHTMVAVKRFGEEYQVIYANSILGNDVGLKAAEEIRQAFVESMPDQKVSEKIYDISRDIQKGTCCGLSVIVNAINVIESTSLEDLVQKTDALTREVQQDRSEFYQKKAKETHAILFQRDDIKKIQIEEDQKLAFQLQKEEINQVIEGSLSRAVTKGNIVDTAQAIWNIGAMIGAYEYKNFIADQNLIVARLQGGDLTEKVNKMLQDFSPSMPSLNSNIELKLETVNKWQEYVSKSRESGNSLQR
jgi:hypothetical protein